MRTNHKPGRWQAGFSLLEITAVLAIIAVLAAMLLPRWIKRIDLAAREKEVATLNSMREALELEVQRTGTVPDSSTWAQAVARWSALPVSHASFNARNYSRVYFTETSPTPALATAQTYSGSARPENLRAIIVSLLGGEALNNSNCPGPTGGTLSPTDFEALWNTADGSRPTAGDWANWDGDADDFLIQRLNYAPLFHHLVLVNRDIAAASFTINDSSAVSLVKAAPNVGWDAYYIGGTVLGLGNAGGTTLTRYVISRDISFVFEGDYWRGEIVGVNTGNNIADNFGVQAANFLRSQWNSSAQKGADQQGVLTAMYSFMYTYTLWADQCPHFPMHGATAVQVPEYLMMQSIGDPNRRLEEFATGLVK